MSDLLSVLERSIPYSGGESKPEEVNRCPQMTNTELGCHVGTGKCGAHGHRRLGWGTQTVRLSLRSSTQAGQGCLQRRELGCSGGLRLPCGEGQAKQEPSPVGSVVAGA